MKGMKKLFALLAVLTMALTMTPMVAPVAAADQLTVEINNGETATTLYTDSGIDGTYKVTTLLEVTSLDYGTGTINPENPDVSYSWAVDHPETVTLMTSNATTTMLIGAKGEGKTTVRVTVEYAQFVGYAAYEVTVKGHEINVTLDQSSLVLYTDAPGNSATLNATVTFNGEGVDPSMITASWASQNNNVTLSSMTPTQAVVKSANTNTATDEVIYSATITYTATTYVGTATTFTATRAVSVDVDIKEHSFEIVIDEGALQDLQVGQEYLIEATPSTTYPLEGATITYQWNATGVLQIVGGATANTVNVKVTKPGTGTLTVTATYTLGIVEETDVDTATVSVDLTFDVKIDQGSEITLVAGSTSQLTTTVTTNDPDFSSADVTYSWESDDPYVVKVEGDGSKATIIARNLTATEYANVKVTATYKGKTDVATIKVTVVPAPAAAFDVAITGTNQLVLDATSSYAATVTSNIPGFDVNAVTYLWESNNTSVLQITTDVTGKDVVVKAVGEGYATLKVTAKYGQYTAEAYITVQVVRSEEVITGVILEYSASRWVKVGGQWLYQVDYNVYNAPTNAQNMVVQLKSGNQVLGESALSFRQVSAPFSSLWSALGHKDGTVKLELVNSTASTVVPVTFFKVESELKGSYVSGEAINEATGTIATVAGDVTLGSPKGLIPMALVGVWKDADGKTQSKVLHYFNATIGDDGTYATFAFQENDFTFTVPAGKVYLVSGTIAENLSGALYSGIAVEKFAYKTIEIKQAKFTVNPKTIILPPFDKEVYVYDEFGYPVRNTQLKVEFGYKVTATKDAEPIFARTDGNGKLTLKNIPTPVNYGTYTATLSTVVGSSAVVDGVAVLQVSYVGQLVLSDSIIHPKTIHQLGTIKINVESSGSPIKKLWINVADPNNVLEDYDDPNDILDGAELLVEDPFKFQQDAIKEGPCNVEKVVDQYWFAKDGQKTAVLYGTAVQGGTITVTATAELADGSLAVATKEYVVKAYRIASISPASIEYGSSGTVKVVIKDWYNGYVDGLNVQLVSENEYNQVGPNQFTLIPENFGTYSFTIPAGAVPGSYAVKIDGVDYSEWSWTYFSVAPIPDLKVTAPATVNAMSKFDVSVTDKSGNVVNGTWSIKKQVSGSVVNGKFTVDTAAFKDGSSLGNYTITIITSDGKHLGSAVVSIVAPSTITPTAVVTHGFKSTVVVTMTSTSFNASLIDLVAKTYSTLDKVTVDKVYSAQTATVVVKVLKSDMCSIEPKLTLKYGKFVLDNGALKIDHPQLSFVKTATWYARDIVPMQVKLVDALGNPIKGAVVKVSQLGYFELTATTNAEGIADFGNITLNAAGNVVAELIFNPELERVVDYRLFGQTDNTNYKVIAQVEPARPAQDLKVTVTPTIVDAGKDALLTLTLVGADDKPVETGKNVVVTIGPSTYNGLVGANGVVTLTVKSESLTGTVVTGVVKVEGYNAATFTLAVKPAEEPEYKTVIELAPGMDIYTVNGETKFWDATPYIKEGRTLVPIRHLAEAVGFKASWDFSDPANKMVFIFKADQDPEKDKEHPFILLIIGQPTAMVNGNLVALDVAPEILNGRTMVPLRFVVETLGYKVEWLGNTIRLMK